MVVPDGSPPVVCKGLEDQPEPLLEPGPSYCMARQIVKKRKVRVPINRGPGEGGDPRPKWAPAFAGVKESWWVARTTAGLLLQCAIGAAAPSFAQEEPKHGGTL